MRGNWGHMKYIMVVSAAVAIVLIGGAYLAVRKYGIRVELTRNLEANQKAEILQAHENLQRLASDPKLTVVWQRSENLGEKRDPIVLCVLKRPIVAMLVNATGSTEAAGRPLLERLDSVDVEPVPYSKKELPTLISEIAAVQRGNPLSPFSGDLNELLAALKKEGPPETEVVFY